ncbi:MAG: site-specific DNA-methyltransferase, partial [Chitinophagia bacterium]|nr:site-specific DNA-methyltransferase [Chitinophagia bacterium]
GDNLEVLRKYIPPESIDLCYIDPPFNSKRNYNQIYNNIGTEDKAQAQAFTDTWTWDDVAVAAYNDIVSGTNPVYTKKCVELIRGLFVILEAGSLMAYLVSMTQRIAEIYRVLKPTGSFYLHCDPTASHYLKLVLDAIFCMGGGEYKNEIVWRRHYSHNDGNKFGCIHDVILYYTKSNSYLFNRQFLAYDTTYITKNYNLTDPATGKKYRSVSMNAAGQGEAKYFGDKLLHPPKGTHWRWNQDRINEAIKNNIIYFTKTGVPRYKQFLEDMQGVPVQDVWTDFYGLSSHDKERLGYSTQKPEALLERIIKASSNEGDTVLDAYCGCGTTIAVAQRLNRNWIGVDITYQSISVILKRLTETFGNELLNNITLSGIPKDKEAAKALALKKDDRVRKEFEKWAVLTYSNNKAMINEKKGADGGIDGTAYILTGSVNRANEHKDVIFSVKSGKVGVDMIRAFDSVINTNPNTAMGIFITLEEPTKPMLQLAKSAGIFTNPLTGQQYPKLAIVTIDAIIKGERLELPQAVQVLKEAGKQKDKGKELGF